MSDEECESESLCVDCAKHPSVKRFVAAHATTGVRCGVCRRKDSARQVCNPDNADELSNLVRALIRFYYDEWDYNRHWGGDTTPEGILSRENPIIEHRAASPPEGDGGGSEVLVECLLSPPYPDPDKGISVYAGFHEGIRLGQSSLQSKHPDLIQFEHRLLTQNYFEVEPDIRAKVGSFANDVEAFIESDAIFSRARIGVGAHFRRWTDGFDMDIRHQPYMGALISAPPPPIAGAGRLNRPGVSYLYLASDPATAAAEVRPHPGHLLSVSGFRATRRIKIADFSVDIAGFCTAEARLNMFHFIHSVDTLMSTPVTPEETRRHSLSQLIADVARQAGFEGIRYGSPVADGSNLCVFVPQTFETIPGSEKVLRVDGLAYTLADAPTLLAPTSDDEAIDL